MARKRKGDPVHGVLLINKPSGASSNRVLQHYKHALFAQKAGHTGALDPLATGLLPLCFGEATKFSQLLLNADKTYQTTARLGIRTDTCDADGQITSQKEIPELSPEMVTELVNTHFVGLINQVAPIYSALKVNGRPMYELARAGVEVEAKSREVTVYSISVDRIAADEIDLTIHCSKGTYIRSIIDELGQLLGCGAHVSKLHRIQHGAFRLDQVKVSGESDKADLLASLLPVDTLIENWPVAWVTDESAERFLHGNPATTDTAELPEDREVRVYDRRNDRFIGTAKFYAPDKLQPRRVIHCN